MSARQIRLVAAVFLLALLSPQPAAAEPDGAAGEIVWVHSLIDAQRESARTGRPLLLVVQSADTPTHLRFPFGLSAWRRHVYADPAVAAAAQAFVCVLARPARPLTAARTRDVALRPSAPRHLLLAPDGSRLLAELPGRALQGPETARAGLLSLFAAARPPADAPAPDLAWIRARNAARLDARRRAPVIPEDAEGFWVRLTWPLEVARFAALDAEGFTADLELDWNGAGPVPLGRMTFRVGSSASRRVFVPLAVLAESGAPIRPGGRNVIDFFLRTREGDFGFAEDGRLFVQRLEIRLPPDGSGGGGGGAEDETERPAEPPPDPDEGGDEEGEATPPEPPPEEESRVEVINPFTREGETVQKDDALVAVEHPDAALEPPPPIPFEEAMREFERVLEDGVDWERIPVADRAYLRRYFEALRKVAARARGPRGGR